MELIDGYIILVNKKVTFSYIPNPRFITNEISPFQINMDNLLECKNYLTESKKLIDRLNNLKENENYEFYDMQGEQHLNVKVDMTYAELWNCRCEIPTKDFIQILTKFNDFLDRWNSKEKLEKQILLAIKRCISTSHDLSTVFIEQQNSKDQIRLILSNEESKYTLHKYLDSLEWPIHLKNQTGIQIIPNELISNLSE